MATLVETFSFGIKVDPTCWAGTPSDFETKLLVPLSFYALEQFRTRFLFALTTNHAPVKSARALLQMAFDTEIGASLAKLITLAPDVQPSTVCERRSYLDIDKDMTTYGFLIGPALQDLLAQTPLPPAYGRLLTVHLESPYARYRVCAMAALLCFATVYLVVS